MKKQSNYFLSKASLRLIANDAKEKHPTDKPMIRQIINDAAYSLCKGYDLSEYQRNLLSNYACKLHPKEKKKN
jgi:hypothetical protein